MSWYVNAVGRPMPVLEAIMAQINNSHCNEPEESIKTIAATVIEKALTAFPASSAVRVTAQGSQTTSSGYGAGEAINSLEIKIEPLFGFVA